MEKHNNIPVLRFPAFKGVWEQKKLGDVAEKIQDGTHFSPPISDNGKFKYITSKNVRDGYFDYSDIQYIDEEEHRKIYKRCDVVYNDVLITKDGASTGNVCLNTLYEEFSLLSSVAFIRAEKGSALNEFIFQYILSTYGQRIIQSEISGQAITRITLNKIKSFKFSFPTISEQQKIASYFTAIDERLSQIKQKKILLEQYKKGVMQKIFLQEIRFRDEKGQEFPKWENMRFNQIYSFKVTNSFSRNKLNYDSGVVKNIHYGDIHTKFPTLLDITIAEVPYVNSDITIERISDDHYCRPNDLVFADASEDVQDVGKCIELVNLNDEKVLAGLHTILARPNIDKIAKGFGGYLMKSIKVRKQIMKISQGSKVTSISSSRLGAIDINIPCPEEQLKISGFLSNLDDKIMNTQTQIEKAELWKKGLLQKMFV